MTTAPITITQEENKPRLRRPCVEEYVGGFLLALMTVLVFVQILARYVLGSSLAWSEELARYAFIWLIFLTLGAVVVNAQHIIIDAVTSRLPNRLMRWWEQVLMLVSLVLNGVFIVFGAILVVRMAGLGQTSAALQIPMWVVYAALPLGLVLASIRTVQAMVTLWRSGVVHQGEVGF